MRVEIARSLKFVDAGIAQETMDKFSVWENFRFDVVFVGDDWYQTEKWREYEEQFRDVGVKVIYFPYTKGTSSSLINEMLEKLR